MISYTEKGQPRLLNITGIRSMVQFLRRAFSGKAGRHERIQKLQEEIAALQKQLRAVQEREERYRQYFALSNDMMFVHSPVTEKIVECNDTTVRILGYSREELFRMSPQDLVDPSLLHRSKELRRQILADDHILFETVFITRKGKKIPVEVNAHLVEQNGERLIFSVVRDITPRKQAEEALRQSEQEYRGLFENAHDAILIFTPEDEIILEVNPQACRLYGFSREEFIGMSLKDLSRDPARGRKAIRKTLLEKKFHNFHTTQFTKDGRELHLEVNASVVNYRGRTAILSINRDITERKRSEAVQAALYRIAETTASTADMQEFYRAIHGIVGELMYAGNFYIALYEHAEQLLRFPYFVDEYDPPMKERKSRRGLTEYVIRTQKPLLVDTEGIRRLHEQGEIEVIGHLPVDWLGVPLKSGEVTFGVLAVQSYHEHIRFDEKDKELLTFVGQHIAHALERKQYLDRLAAKRRSLMVTLDSIADGVITTDGKGKILFVNRVAEKLTGCSQDTALGQAITEVFRISEDQADETLLNPVREPLKTGKLLEKSKVYLHPLDDDRIRIISLSTAPIVEDENGGEIVGAVVAFHDITDQQRREQEMQKMEKLESLGILAGGIAHDFNNILTAVIGNITLAKSQVGDMPGPRKRLEEAEKACFRARDLTRQLLTFSKGGAPIKKAVSLAELIQETARFCLRGSNIRGEFHFPKNLWPVEVDEGQISQVINNMVINAIQAMPDGGVIRIACANHEFAEDAREQGIPLPPGKYVQITIQDQGVGIPREYIDRIFDPYFTTKQQGSGLGLATCYSIISRHGGHIAVESEPGKGSLFTTYLPARPGLRISRKKRGAPSQMKPSDQKGHVLVMDDEEPILELTEQMLKRLGYACIRALNGKEAVKKFREACANGRRVDLVILDLTIPGGMGGLETLEKLREVDPNIKAVVASGYSNDPIMSHYREYGFQECIVKPFTYHDVSEMLNRLF